MAESTPVLAAFRSRFVRNPEVHELTPFGFFEAGWRARDTEVERLRDALQSLKALVDQQAEDEGLWFDARYITEAYLQGELRKLHAAVENAVGASTATLQPDPGAPSDAEATC